MCIGCALMLTLAVGAAEASAQFTKKNPNATQLPTTLPANLPAGAVQGSTGQMSPEQVQQLYWLRALQSRGNRPVRTGYPQFVPFGGPGFSGFPGFPMPNAQQPAVQSSADQKKAAREEKKRIAREKAEAKKAAAEKAKAAAKAKNKAKGPA